MAQQHIKDAFFFFCEARRPAVEADLKTTGPEKVEKELRLLWSRATAEEKSECKLEATKEKLRKQIDRLVQSQKIEDLLSAPTSSMKSSPYFHFVGLNRKRIKKEHKLSSIGDVMSKAGELWRTLPEAERSSYANSLRATENHSPSPAKIGASAVPAGLLKRFRGTQAATRTAVTRRDNPEAKRDTSPEPKKKDWDSVPDAFSPVKKAKTAVSAMALTPEKRRCSAKSPAKLAPSPKKSSSFSSIMTGMAKAKATTGAKMPVAKSKAMKQKPKSVKNMSLKGGKATTVKKVHLKVKKMTQAVEVLPTEKAAVAPKTKAKAKASAAKPPKAPEPQPIIRALPKLPTEVIRKACDMGLKGSLLNLACRQDVAKEGFDGQDLLDALKQARGNAPSNVNSATLVDRAQKALLASLKTAPMSNLD